MPTYSDTEEKSLSNAEHSDCHYFFRMKVGTGNSALYFALMLGIGKSLEEYPHNARQKADLETEVTNKRKDGALKDSRFFLYTGWDSDTWIPTLQKDGTFRNVQTNNQASNPDLAQVYSAIPEKQPPDDLYWIAFAVSAQGAEMTRILVYGATHLFIFKPIKESWYQPKTVYEKAIFPTAPNTLLDHDLKRLFPGPKSKDLWRHFLEAAALEVELCHSIRRTELPPAIDSLSVFQWLNQGTFRPIFSCGAGRDPQMPSDIKQKIPRVVIKRDKTPIRISMTDEKKEYKYAVLVREYFDGLLLGSQSQAKSYVNYVYLLLSPAQLEAAAALLSMDLGFMPDFYDAGSQDYIDIRARCLRGADPNRDFKKKVEDILKGQMSNWDWPSDVLQFQCKNYEQSDDTADESVILFEPLSHETSPSPGPDSKTCGQLRLNLKTLYEIQKESAGNFHLKSWLELQEAQLSCSAFGCSKS